MKISRYVIHIPKSNILFQLQLDSTITKKKEDANQGLLELQQ